jgi:amino acid adenylation domain-containing protein
MQLIIFSPDGSAKPTPLHAARPLPEQLRRWSGARTEYPRGATVSSVFEQVARERASEIALVQNSTELTYGELNTRANRLAHRLRAVGVKPETMVACCFERSIEMIVAILAILKAGGAYLPLDPAYPKARLDLILKDAGTPPIVTRKSLARSVLTEYSSRILLLDDESESLPVPEGEQQDLQQIAGPTSLAYVLYTSGSTGRPKGVMIEHRGILRLVRNTNYCRFEPDEKFLQFAPISFDASTFEIWGALLNGSTLVLMPPQSSSLDDLLQVIREHHVTTLWLTAGLFHLLVEEHPDGLRSLRQLLAGGDVLSPRHVRLFLEHAPNTTLINGYGPTENTTFTCCHVMRAGDSIPESIPIGKPISNTRVYILDQDMNPVAPGEIGDLYAAGDGVARGYLNDPDTTAAKFLLDPFTADPFPADASQRMYHTGDLARWRPDGTIEFLGRVDAQVKILGYRIEPSEVEAALQRHAQVKQACVIARAENGGKRLAAFFVPSDSGPTPEELRAFALSQLPQHMVPAFFASLPALPLSDNGKVDRAVLSRLDIAPKPKQDLATASVPGSEIEPILTQLWQRVLNVPAVGLDDNFFDIGGDSLLLVSVHSNLQKTLQTKIPVTDLFEFPTIRKLAAHLGPAKSNSGAFSDARERAQRQREVFARSRRRGSGGES